MTADWSRRFVPAIPLPDGLELVTLRDAGTYITKLPESEQDKEHWRTAIKLLILIGDHGGDPMMARIAMMQALHYGQPAPIAPRKRAKSYRIIR